MPVEDFLGGLGGFGLDGIMGIAMALTFAVGALILIGGIIYLIYSAKKWNMRVEFKLPRAVKYLKEGEILNIDDIKGSLEAEIGKGFFDLKRGVVWLKRKGKKKSKMKPFRINKFLQPSSKGKPILTVVQVGIDEYYPVAPESYMIMEDDESGEQVTVLDMKTDASEAKAWETQFERETKSTYSVQNSLMQLLSNPAFLIGLTIFLWGIQLLLLYNRIKG